MKLTTVVGFACTAQAFNILKDKNLAELDDWEFLEQSVYGMWNGFVRGFYNESSQNVVSEQCLGAWVNDEIKQIGDFFTALLHNDWTSVTFENTSKVTQMIVDVAFKHNSDCKFTKFYSDLFGFFSEDPKNSDLKVIGENCLKNSPQLISKAVQFWEMLWEDLQDNDQELIAYGDRIMEIYGQILRLVFNFDMGPFQE